MLRLLLVVVLGDGDETTPWFRGRTCGLVAGYLRRAPPWNYATAPMRSGTLTVWNDIDRPSVSLHADACGSVTAACARSCDERPGSAVVVRASPSDGSICAIGFAPVPLSSRSDKNGFYHEHGIPGPREPLARPIAGRSPKMSVQIGRPPRDHAAGWTKVRVRGAVPCVDVTSRSVTAWAFATSGTSGEPPRAARRLRRVISPLASYSATLSEK